VWAPTVYRDVVNPPSPPFVILGGPNFVSEVATVFEIGYRARADAVVDLLRDGFPARMEKVA
jgi:hypothetical protein